MLGLLRNTSVGRKVALLSGFLLTGLLVAGIIGYRGVLVLDKRQNDIAEQLVAVRSMSLMDMMHDALRAVVFRAVIAAQTKNELEKKGASQELQEFSQEMKTYLNQIEVLPLRPTTKEAIARARPVIDAYTAKSAELVNLALTGQRQQVNSQLPGFQATFEQLEQELKKLGDLIEQDAQASVEIGNRSAAWAQRTVVIVMVAALVFGILLSVYFSRLITVALQEALSTVTASSSGIAVTVEEQERMASQQAAAVNQTTTTMDELGASSRQSAEQAEASATGARQALALAEAGTQAVQQTQEGMSTLKEKVGAIAEQILRLSEQTSQIGNISGLVSDLANQTNMLALNAAVEAARAGEQGKGFAVVASEIRKLADQSKKSAEKINALVTDIQTTTNSTVMVTDEGTKTVESIVAAISNVVLNSQQISLSAKQQSIAIQQVVDAMNALNGAAKETAIGISQTKVSIEKLNKAAQVLRV